MLNCAESLLSEVYLKNVSCYFLNSSVKKETDCNNSGTQNRENMRRRAYDHHTCKMQLL